MSDPRKPHGRRQAASRPKGMLVVDGSNATAALSNPTATITEPATQVVPMGDYPIIRLIFGGTTTANQTVNYQIIGWHKLPVTGQKGLWVGIVIAKGVFTLGSSAAAGITNGKFADTITQTLSNTNAIITPGTPDNSVASLTLDTRNAMIITVETNVVDATLAYAWAIPGEPGALKSGGQKKTPVKLVQAVATPGTGEALVTTETFAVAFYLQAKRVDGNNTGRVYLGLSDVDKTTAQLFDLGPNDPAWMEMPPDSVIDLNEIYVDAVTATDGVVGYYLPA